MIRGEFVDNWDTEHAIAQDVWMLGESKFHIAIINNEGSFLIAQNDEDNAWNPALWSRFDWTHNEDGLWYCQTTYDAESEEAALAVTAADPTNPATAGCGSFGWTRLDTALSIRGAYVDNWGTEHAISQTTWLNGESTFIIDFIDHEQGFLIAQNGEANAYNPGLWSRFDWTRNDEGLWYCQSAYDADSAEEALTASADATDPAVSGCGSFSWTKLEEPASN